MGRADVKPIYARLSCVQRHINQSSRVLTSGKPGINIDPLGLQRVTDHVNCVGLGAMQDFDVIPATLHDYS